MIIAVFEGSGMSGFRRITWDGIDLSALPYRYVMPGITAEMETEAEGEEAGVTECPLDDEWPTNYLRSIVMAYHRYSYVVIPMVHRVLEELRRLRIPYVLCYPERALSEEDWIARDEYGRHIVLEPDESPGDRRKEIEQYTREQEVTMPIELDEKLLGIIRQRYKEGGLCVEEGIRQMLMYVVENPEAFQKMV